MPYVLNHRRPYWYVTRAIYHLIIINRLGEYTVFLFVEPIGMYSFMSMVYLFVCKHFPKYSCLWMQSTFYWPFYYSVLLRLIRFFPVIILRGRSFYFLLSLQYLERRYRIGSSQLQLANLYLKRKFYNMIFLEKFYLLGQYIILKIC